MITIDDILETNRMITENKLDVRTITMGISLRDCAHPNMQQFCQNVYEKITSSAEFLVRTGEDIESEYGIPIINKRISVTPIAIAADACKTDSYVPVAETLDKAAKEVGVDFIGGFSALVEKGYTHGDRVLIESIPQALAMTDIVCSSVNLGSTKAGINMDCVREMGEVIKRTAELTRDKQALGCAKLVVFANAPGDNPFMAGAFHGVSEADKVVSVGVSGPGVVKHALEDLKGADFTEVAETIKKTAFKITRVGQLVAREASKRLGVPFGSLVFCEGKADIYSASLCIQNRGGKTLVEMGIVSGKLTKAFSIEAPVYFADIRWNQLMRIIQKQNVTYREISKFPAVSRDLALLLDSSVPFAEVERIAYQTEKKLLKAVKLFDVYEGKKLPEGKKSYAVNFILQDETKTMGDKQIDAVMQKLINNLTKELGAELR